MSDTQTTKATKATKVIRALTGRVVSDKMNKTVTVLIERRVRHPMLGKIVTLSKKYHAHSENNQFKMGDVVEITEGRPISKTKSWTVTKLLAKANLV